MGKGLRKATRMRRASGIEEFQNQGVQYPNGQKNGISSTENGYPKRTIARTISIATPKREIKLEGSE